MQSVTHISTALGWKRGTEEGKSRLKFSQNGKVEFQKTQEGLPFQ